MEITYTVAELPLSCRSRLFGSAAGFRQAWAEGEEEEEVRDRRLDSGGRAVTVKL